MDEEDEVMVVMEKGKIVRSRVDEVRRTGRNTMGVQFATPDKGDSIVAVARNADRGIEGETDGDGDDSGDDAGPGAVPTIAADDPAQTNSGTESSAQAGTVASDEDEDDTAGGSE